METARESTVVEVPLEAAQQRWLEFTEGPGSSVLSEAPGAVSPAELAQDVEHGTVRFDPEGSDSARVTMELRYNPEAVAEAGLTDDWVARRIELYLQRFREHAER